MNLYKTIYYKITFFFSYWCYSSIKWYFTYQTRSIKTNHENWWSDLSCKNISIILWKNDNYKCLTGEEILPLDQRGVIEQVHRTTYSSLWKVLTKQTKTTEDQREKK